MAESARLLQFAAAHQFPLHIHLEEQPGELADCRTFHDGRLPSELLFQNVIGDEKMVGKIEFKINPKFRIWNS